MNKKLYLECFSGISGDMLVASLLDLGADWEYLKESLRKLNLTGYEVRMRRVKKSGLDACDFLVELDEAHENHDHDMAYLHGHHEHESSDVWHKNHHGGHSHAHRGPKEIEQIIREASLGRRAEEIALRIFGILAEAEAKAHGVDTEQVHFHEVGAVDSIVDIVSIAVCIENLGITEVIVPMLYEGGGMIRCQHGLIPVPVPAVVNIAEKHRLLLHRTEVEGELVTPTGAAAAAALVTSKELPREFTVLGIGLGAGKRNYEVPGILRAMLIEEKREGTDFIYKLETNIDDCTGEALGYVMEALFAAGAKDVHYTPVFMKKNRPAYQLNVICKAEDVSEMEKIIFSQTTTIGIRRQKMERAVLEREIKEIHTSLGMVKVKVCGALPEKRVYPEYESIADICRRTGMPYAAVYGQIVSECCGKTE